MQSCTLNHTLGRYYRVKKNAFYSVFEPIIGRCRLYTIKLRMTTATDKNEIIPAGIIFPLL